MLFKYMSLVTVLHFPLGTEHQMQFYGCSNKGTVIGYYDDRPLFLIYEVEVECKKSNQIIQVKENLLKERTKN